MQFQFVVPVVALTVCTFHFHRVQGQCLPRTGYYKDRQFEMVLLGANVSRVLETVSNLSQKSVSNQVLIVKTMGRSWKWNRFLSLLDWFKSRMGYPFGVSHRVTIPRLIAHLLIVKG